MKMADYLKRTAAALVTRGAEVTSHREMAEKRAAWEAQLLEAQRQYRATHPPGTRVPMPRFLGLPWPPPPLPPNTTIPTPHEIWSEDQ